MTRIYGHQKRRLRTGERQKSREESKRRPPSRRIRLPGAEAIGCTLSVLLLSMPEVCLNAAREAMLAWYMSVAPALFPFMALMPMLTSPAAARGYERLPGRLMQFLFNLPGAAAPAVVIGMVAGSPAGAAAAVRTCAAAGLTGADAARLTMCCCGLSPAFLITGVGAAMLGNPADGTLLLRAQILSQLTMLAATRRTQPSEPVQYEETENADGVGCAVTAVLGVCGYMVLFNIAAAVIARLLRSEIAGLAALCLLDLPSGARALAALNIGREGKLLLLAATCGLGGGCIAAQNLAACKNVGISKVKYLCARASHAVLMTGFTALQLSRNSRFAGKIPEPLEFSALIAVILLVPALISLKKDLFLNKRNFEKLPEKRPKNA